MKLSARIQSLTSSPIRKLSPYADAAKAKGKKIYHLNIGQPDIKTPDQFMESIRTYDEQVIAYGNSKGEGFLIEAIRKYYAEKGMDFAADDIFITNGGSEALIFAVMALCDPGDEIMVFEPFYANYTTFAREFGAKINAVQTNVTDGYHLPDAAAIEAQITPRTKAVLLTNPGNPTGVVYTQEEMDMISAIVRKYDLALIADEVYREFVYDGAYRSFGTMPELADNLIIIDSVSKRYSACGARIGCIINKNKELAKQIIKCCQSRLCSPILEQVGAAALYTTPVSYLEEVNQEYKKRRDTIVAHEFLGASVEGKDVIIVDDMISSGESMLDTAKELKRMKARKVFICTTFGLFTGGLKKFDEYYENGIIDRVLTTNLVYQTPELLSKPYYINVDMSKYIALIIDNLNHDASLSDLLNPTGRINRLLAKYRAGER